MRIITALLFLLACSNETAVTSTEELTTENIPSTEIINEKDVVTSTKNVTKEKVITDLKTDIVTTEDKVTPTVGTDNNTENNTENNNVETIGTKETK